MVLFLTLSTEEKHMILPLAMTTLKTFVISLAFTIMEDIDFWRCAHLSSLHIVQSTIYPKIKTINLKAEQT
jgi:hypothetical protein